MGLVLDGLRSVYDTISAFTEKKLDLLDYTVCNDVPQAVKAANS